MANYNSLNTLAAITPTIFTQGLMVLRQNAVMARLVNRDYQTEVAQLGNVINVSIPSEIDSTDVVPSGVYPTTAPVAPTTVPITLNQWKETAFQMSDADIKVAINGVLPMEASAAIKGLANTVDKYILNSFYPGVYSYYGAAGTTPFNANGQLSATEAAQIGGILSNTNAPTEDRRLVLEPFAQANAINLRGMQDSSWTGDRDVMIKGLIAQERLGFDWYMDQNMPTQATTPLTSGAATANGVNALGSTTISIAKATNTSPLIAGDLFTIAGNTQSYTVVTAVSLAVGNTTVTISPGLAAATAGGEAITLIGPHRVNLGFHRDAYAFVSRPLDNGPQGESMGSLIEYDTDPISGLSLRLEVKRWNKLIRWSWDILYGGALVRPSLAARLIG